tara:strand:- start:115 stop:1338 length:1224 start_codon:yes stop_codon:yes gene_type:complete
MLSIPLKRAGNTPLNALHYVEMIILIILFFIFTATPLFAYAQDSQEELIQSKEYELQEVRKRINSLKNSMDRATDEQEKLIGELKEIELGLSERRIKINEIEAKQRSAEQKKQALNADLADSKAYFNDESNKLALQLRAAYISGSQEKIKLLLNQRDPAMLGRLMVYYQYFNDYRIANISNVVNEIKKINELNHKIENEEKNLLNLANYLQIEIDELNLSSNKREKLLINIDKRLAKEGLQVNQLLSQERSLEKLISDISNILSDFPVSSETSFLNSGGRLDWPVDGKVIHDFGHPRAGGKINWNGVVFAVPRGTAVHAIYYGRIAFADWLTGMGLLVIVDHGDGYMSLYAHNETILKNTGDRVSPGDVIATVGDSGGQQQSSLYFEIRKGAKPINPRDWVTENYNR